MKKSKFLKSLLLAFVILPCVLVMTACNLAPVQTINGRDGKDGVTPHIGMNGNWWLGDEDLGIYAVGKNGADGNVPYIGENLTWWIGTQDTGILAIGRDGVTPHIGTNLHWWIGNYDTGHIAIGQNGKDGGNGITPHIGSNGNWWYDDFDTGWPALGQNGTRGTDGIDGTDGLTPFIYNGTWWIGVNDTGVIADVDVLHFEYQALLNYIKELNVMLEYLQSLLTPAPVSFAFDSWQTIVNVSASGLAHNFYNVGDEKTIMLQDGEIVTLVILGFNHDNLSNGMGKAGISIGTKGLMIDSSVGNETATNIGGWQDSFMRNVTMAEIFDRLPNTLQSIIKQVNKASTIGGSSTNIAVTQDKLWLLSRVELDGTAENGYVDEGTQYEYWAGKNTNADREKRKPDGLIQNGYWRLRSAATTNNSAFVAVNPNGSLNVNASAVSDWGISFGFCI